MHHVTPESHYDIDSTDHYDTDIMTCMVIMTKISHFT